MERIQGVLLKLQELYFDKRQKTSIDLDLMLDYTRVLYADLLEWRKNVPEGVTESEERSLSDHPGTADATTDGSTPEDEVPPSSTTTEELSKTQDTSPTASSQEAAATPADQEVTIENEVATPEPDAKAETAPAPTRDTASEISPTSEGKSTESSAKAAEGAPAAPRPAPPEAPDDAAEAIAERRGINFEPPDDPSAEADTVSQPKAAPAGAAAQEAKPAADPRRAGSESVSQVNRLAQKASVLPDYTTMLHQRQRQRKDIRAEIGINDRYLYLNELFGNQKAVYESVLGRLNELQSLSDARSYIRNEVAPAQKWDDEDETVQDFYALLQKHFVGR